MRNLLALTNPQEFMQLYVPIRNQIFRRTRKEHVRIPRKNLFHGSKLARIIDRAYLDTGGIMDPKKILVFDNSQKGYRLSGSRTKSIKPIEKLIEDSGVPLSCGQPGTYVARKANNGLFPTLTAERSFYRKMELYERIMAGDDTLLKEYFDFEGLMHGQYVIQHDVRVPIPYIDLEEPSVVESIFDINRGPVSDLLMLYRDFGVQGLPDLDDVAGLRDLLISGDMYDFSQPFGNAMLESSTAIQFGSARAKVAPVQQYFEGGGNMVIPNNRFVDMPYDDIYYMLKGKEVLKFSGSTSSTFASLH